MKRFIYLITVLYTVLVSLSTLAMAEPLKLYGGGVQSKEMKNLSNAICGELARSNVIADLCAPDAFRNAIANHLGIPVDNPSTRQKVITFWNENKDQLICTVKNPKYTSPQTVLRRIIDMGLQEHVFFDFLLDDPNDDYTGLVDINVVFKHPDAKASDKPETMLDYIENIILDPSKKGYYDYEVLADLTESLRDEYGGKYVKYADKYPEFALELESVIAIYQAHIKQGIS